MTENKSRGTRGNILVVDDTKENLKFLVKTLSAEGYVVRPALDGHLAISAALKEPPDLILMDVMMPGMDGYKVCEMLKAESSTKDIPVIFLSALDDVTDKVKGFSAGGVDYITKPFHVDELLVRIKSHLAMHENERLKGVIELSGAVCHEMNQPLQIISGKTELLMLKISQDDPIYKDIQIINHHVELLGKITKKLAGIDKYRTKTYLKSKIIDLKESSDI